MEGTGQEELPCSFGQGRFSALHSALSSLAQSHRDLGHLSRAARSLPPLPGEEKNQDLSQKASDPGGQRPLGCPHTEQELLKIHGEDFEAFSGKPQHPSELQAAGRRQQQGTIPDFLAPQQVGKGEFPSP